MKRVYGVIFAIALGHVAMAQEEMRLWYDEPAEFFEQSLALGNGRMGACLFGGTLTETIFLNDMTLWSGEPVKANVNPEALSYLPKVRQALSEENYPLADELCHKMQGVFSQSYSPLGTLKIDFIHDLQVKDYYRELDISKAIATVSYDAGGIRYTREYFVSHPGKVMAVKLSANRKGALDFNLVFTSQLPYKATASGRQITATGYAPYHVEPAYRKDIENPYLFDPARGTRFSTLCNIVNTGGRVTATDGRLSVKGADEAIIYVSVATSFNSFDRNPATEGLNHVAIAAEQMDAALAQDYIELKSAHLKDYCSFYNRFSINLGRAEDMPTDKRLEAYATGTKDPYLEALYVQYGRYLLISSSRTPSVPANLQGIWNPHMRPPWSSNYTTNINVEENYWLAESTNLSEMHEPLLDFVSNISKTGAHTAREFLGTGGWAACHNSDIWALSNPVGDFGHGSPGWANWYFGGVWLATHLWEHYDFTQDADYLRRVWPVMRGAVEFCLDWMVEDREGRLITSPSTSPECRYITPSGYKGSVLYGATSDLAMIRELFAQAIKTTLILNEDGDLRNRMESALPRLHPYTIGAKGNLVEWYYDWDYPEPTHRHTSHLFGLYPGTHITPTATPALAQACRRALELRGDEATGWAMGWRINLWARLGDGNHAYKMYRLLLRPVKAEGSISTSTKGGGTYPNLFDAHPPFQIDGNFGAAAGIVEMLVQSSGGLVSLLPALPDAWDAGEVCGVRVRGGFEVSFSWEEHQLTRVTISSIIEGTTTITSGGKSRTVTLKKGESRTIAW